MEEKPLPTEMLGLLPPRPISSLLSRNPGLDLGAGTTSEIASTSQDDELASVQRCCASVVAGDRFSLFGRLNIDGFPKQDPAGQNAHVARERESGSEAEAEAGIEREGVRDRDRAGEGEHLLTALPNSGSECQIRHTRRHYNLRAWCGYSALPSLRRRLAPFRVFLGAPDA